MQLVWLHMSADEVRELIRHPRHIDGKDMLVALACFTDYVMPWMSVWRMYSRTWIGD